MERRALLAIVISVAILFLYQEFVLQRFYPQQQGPAGVAEKRAAEEQGPPPPEPAEARPELPPVAEEEVPPTVRVAPAEGVDVEVETDLYRAVFTTAGGRLRSLELKRYRTANRPDSPLLELIVPGAGEELPMGIEFRGAQTTGDDGVVYELHGGPLHLTGEQEGTLTLTWRGPGVLLEKRLRFKGNRYPIGLEVAPLQIPEGVNEIGLSWVKGVTPENSKTSRYRYQGVVALLDNKLLRKAFTDLEKGEILSGTVGWAGYGDTYFLSAVIPEGDEKARLWLKLRDHTAEARVLMRASAAQVMPFLIYVGPKDYEVLEHASHGLVRAIDLGYFAFIAAPMLRVLRLSHTFTHNYGIDIILLTLAIKVLFIPLTQKSFKSMKEMQKLQPQMAKVRERLKDKPDEMNREIMELYRRHKVNPLSGCLPMVLQIPVFIGLYNALLNAIELRHAPFALWITDLSQPDRLGAVQLPFVEPAGIPVLTLFMGGTMFVQQWMTPSTGDPTQQRMMMIMPLIFTFMFINFPSGLVLYWLVNNVLTIAQQYAMTRTGK